MNVKNFLVVPLLLVLLTVAGCAHYKSDRDIGYYSFRPDYTDDALDRSKTNGIVKVTDEDVFRFSAAVKHKLRRRLNISRIAREISSTLQVMTAAAAAALGVAEGDVPLAVTALAASSAVIPQFQEIFDAKHRAEAYNQGVALVADAESDYLGSVNGLVSREVLTTAGAKLAIQINATLKLVETALASQIPDIKNYEAAHGVLSEKVKTSSSAVRIAKGQTTEIAVLDGPTQIIAASDAPANASVVADPARKVVKIKGEAPGRALITVGDGSGSSSKIAASVFAPITVAPASISLTAGQSKPVTVTSDEDVTFLSSDGIDVQFHAGNARLLDITRSAAAGPDVKILLKNASGGSAEITVARP